MNHFKRLTCILLWLLVAACGGKNDGASESFNNAAVDSYAGASTALLDSLAALYPNGKLPADRAAQSAKDLSENPAVLLLTSEASKQIRGQSTGAVMRPMALSADYKPVIRIQNTSLFGVYFFTIYDDERATALVANPNWRQEGPAFWASLATGDGLSPVHRFRNLKNGSYLYTIYDTERTDIETNYASTFVYEGVAWYARQTQSDGWTPLYRFRNVTNGTYLFSAYESEKDAIITNYPTVFKLEGVAYYVQGVPVVPTPTLGAILCDYATNVFNSSASVNATSTSTWSCTSTKRNLTANGLPDHAVGAFPNANNPNAIAAQSVSASLNLTPSYNGSVRTMGGPAGTTGYVLNGVKIDAATAGTCNDTGSNCTAIGNVGSWNIEAINSGFNFGTDSNNAHVQPGGTYHYHGMPEGFIARLGKGATMTLIGWAADGYPIYARYGYATASSANSPIKIIASSYRLKSSVPSNRPSTSQYKLGTFQQDYEYVSGSGDLDECNGRNGVTPEFPSGTYHYFAIDTYPFLQRCVKGNL
jgi:YHYH protein/Repeat of unknown function (DUF5648)